MGNRHLDHRKSSFDQWGKNCSNCDVWSKIDHRKVGAVPTRSAQFHRKMSIIYRGDLWGDNRCGKANWFHWRNPWWHHWPSRSFHGMIGFSHQISNFRNPTNSSLLLFISAILDLIYEGLSYAMKSEFIRKPRTIIAGFSNRFFTMNNFEWWVNR